MKPGGGFGAATAKPGGGGGIGEAEGGAEAVNGKEVLKPDRKNKTVSLLLKN